MTLVEAALGRLEADLAFLGARWALIGGLAVGVRSEPRNTRDVDAVVAVAKDEEAERLVFAIQARGYRVAAGIEQTAAKRLSTVRLIPPGEPGRAGVLADLLFASSGIEPEIVAAAERLEVAEGLVVPVATIAHLLALKVLAGRPLPDQLDIQQLLRWASPSDVEMARISLALIRERGFDRGKELEPMLDRLAAGRRG